MEAVSYSDLRQNLKSHLDRVYQDNDPLIVTRKNDENVVVISLPEYNSLTETNYLLGSKANAAHLQKSIEQHKNGKTALRKLCDLD